MKFIIRFFICGLVCAGLIACQTLDDKRKIDYRNARTVPPLDIPPDLSVIPENGGANSTATYSEFIDKKNPGATPGTVLIDAPDMRIARDGQARWLVVKRSPEELWPQVHKFVLDMGLIIARENAAVGVIETEWSENHAKVTASQSPLVRMLGMFYSTGTRDKFLLRLDRGLQPGTTEVYVAHRGMEEIYVQKSVGTGEEGNTRWQPRPPDTDVEAEMLRMIMVQLGKTDEQATAIVAQTPTAPPERAQLAHQGEEIFLSVDDAPDRAWRRLGLSLDRLGFTIEDRDRSKGVYYVRYIDPDRPDPKPGFWARLFGAKEKKDIDQYQIFLQSTSAGTRIDVKDKDGVPDKTKTGERILSLLQEQLK